MTDQTYEAPGTFLESRSRLIAGMREGTLVHVQNELFVRNTSAELTPAICEMLIARGYEIAETALGDTQAAGVAHIADSEVERCEREEAAVHERLAETCALPRTTATAKLEAQLREDANRTGQATRDARARRKALAIPASGARQQALKW